MANKVDAKQLLLYMLYLGVDGTENIPIEGTTRIQKMFFIFEKEILPCLKKKDYEPPEFFAYNYGPYSKSLSDNLRFFVNLGYIQESTLEFTKPDTAVQEEIFDESDWLFEDLDLEKEKEPVREYAYTLTNLGINYVEQNLLNLYSDEDKKVLQEFKNKVISMPLSGIIDYVYHKYKDMTTKSLIRDRVLGDSNE